MKLILSTIFLVLVSFNAGYSQEASNIGVVDMTRTIKEFYKFKDATNQLQDDAAKAQKEINERLELRKNLTEEGTKLAKQFQDPLATKEVKEKLQQQLIEKRQELSQLEKEIVEFKNRRQRQIKDQQSRLFSGIRDEAVQVVQSVATTNGLGFVLDTSYYGLTQINGLVVPGVVHSAGANDITDKVIGELNKDAPATPEVKDAPATPAAK